MLDEDEMMPSGGKLSDMAFEIRLARKGVGLRWYMPFKSAAGC